MANSSLRVCLVYDCVYPYTVGGAERWYRELAAELVAAGHQVTYLSRLQWDEGEGADLPGVRVVAVSRREDLYGPDGNRLPGPPVRFGLGVLRHLVRHRHSYDVVHTCGFPYFPVLAIRLALAGRRRRRPLVVVEWVEVWSAAYWQRYLGVVGGSIGALVQRLCVRATPVAVSHSQLHAGRLRSWGYRGPAVTVLPGLYAPRGTPPEPRLGVANPPTVLYVGRHIAEKRVPLVVAGYLKAREGIPGLRLLILGDGPERPAVLRAVEDAGLDVETTCPGFVSADVLERAFAESACLVLPSEREGYGMVVVEAASHGTPTVVVAGEDNAAVELIEPGVNGDVAARATAESLGATLATVIASGDRLRQSTAQWWAIRGSVGTVTGSAQVVMDVYEGRACAPAQPTGPDFPAGRHLPDLRRWVAALRAAGRQRP